MMCRFKVGDKFLFDIDLMHKNKISISGTDSEVHEVLRVDHYENLGEIVTYEIWGYNKMPRAQINAIWLKPV